MPRVQASAVRLTNTAQAVEMRPQIPWITKGVAPSPWVSTPSTRKRTRQRANVIPSQQHRGLPTAASHSRIWVRLVISVCTGNCGWYAESREQQAATSGDHGADSRRTRNDSAPTKNQPFLHTRPAVVPAANPGPSTNECLRRAAVVDEYTSTSPR